MHDAETDVLKSDTMKRMLNVLLPAAILLANLQTAAAEEDEKKAWARKHVKVRTGAVIDGDYFAAGETIEISGTINGDLYVAGSRIVVDGHINGDLLAAGGQVTISGSVAQDARTAGGRVIVSGDIGRNLTVAGGDVQIAHSADVEGGVVVAGGSVEMAGHIKKDVRAAGETITLSGRSGGRLIAAGRAIRLTSNASVAGVVKYWSDTPIVIDEQATIGGAVTRKPLPESLMESITIAGGWLSRLPLIVSFISFVSTLILGLLLIRFSPTSSKDVVDTLRRRMGASFAIGVVALIVTPALAALLLVTVVASPVAVILMALYLITLYVARIYTIILAGELMLDWSNRAVRQGWALTLGAVAYFLLTLIPVFGRVVTVAAVVFGLGATVLMKGQVYRATKADNAISQQ